MLKRILQRLRRKTYPNRFLKFYHLNSERLNRERRSSYLKRKKSGLCTRCRKKAVKGIVFCKYHQERQKEYNRQARS